MISYLRLLQKLTLFCQCGMFHSSTHWNFTNYNVFIFLSWKQNWGVDGLMDHHRLSRTVVTMERLLEVFATGTLEVFCKKLDLIVSLVRGEHNITSWWCFESPGDCFWTDEWRGKLTTSWPKYWSWSTWTTGHSIMFMKAKMKQICSNFSCLDIWCPWLLAGFADPTDYVSKEPQST